MALTSSQDFYVEEVEREYRRQVDPVANECKSELLDVVFMTFRSSTKMRTKYVWIAEGLH